MKTTMTASEAKNKINDLDVMSYYKGTLIAYAEVVGDNTLRLHLVGFTFAVATVEEIEFKN